MPNSRGVTPRDARGKTIFIFWLLLHEMNKSYKRFSYYMGGISIQELLYPGALVATISKPYEDGSLKEKPTENMGLE